MFKDGATGNTCLAKGRELIGRFAQAVWALALAVGCLTAQAQTQTSAYFTFLANEAFVYQSPLYRSTFEAVARMYDYLRSPVPTPIGFDDLGGFFAPWRYSGGTSQRIIHYRVPLNKPAWYGQRVGTSGGYWVVGAATRGQTPNEACQRWAEVNGRSSFYTGVELRKRSDGHGGGAGDWLCHFSIPDTECACVIPFTVLLQIECAPPRRDTGNPDPDGEMLCGSGYRTLVVTQDLTPDKPDTCPAEGNPILPDSAQKVEHETDYDDGRVLKFSRSYGSQRFMPGMAAGAPWTHNYNAGLGLESTEPSASLYRGNGTVAPLSTDSATGSVGAIAGDMLYSGRIGYVAGKAYYTIQSPFEPLVEQFDSEGRLLSRSSADGRFVLLTYSNGTGSYVGPACVLPGGAPAIQPPPWGFASLSCVTDQMGRQLNFEVDLNGRITRVINPAGGVIEYGYDGPTSFVPLTRRATNNLTTVKYPDGFVRTYHYNEPAYTESADLMSALTGVSLSDVNGVASRYSIFKYNATGQAISTEHVGNVELNQLAYATDMSQATVTRPLGAAFTHQYTRILGANRRMSTAQPPGAGSQACSDARTYDGRANVTSRVDFNGNTTCHVYSSRNLEVARIEGLTGGAAVCSTAFNAPPAGSRIITTEWHPDWPLVTRISEPKKITTFVYNGQGANCAPPFTLPNGKPPAVICARAEQATVDDNGALGFGAGLNGVPRTWSYAYSSYGRATTQTDPNGKTTTYTYYADDDPDLGRRGSVATITSAAGHVTRLTTYNAHGQPTQIIDPNGLVTDLAYDARMRLISRSVGNERTTVAYTPTGKLKQVTLPDGGYLLYAYDAAERLTSIRDHRGNHEDYVLDAAGNRIGEQLVDPNGSLARNVQRSFDTLNRVQQNTGLQ